MCSVMWSQVEQGIVNLEADVLLIFDCCHAGRLCQHRDASSVGFFEFFGSCQADQTARSPGEQSFTSALIWALDELSSADEPFDTHQLQCKILEYPRFPHSEQTPVLSDRHQPSGHIVIDRRGLPGSPMMTTKLAPSRTKKEQAAKAIESMDLRLHFDRKIDEQHVHKVIDGLRPLKHNAHYGVNRVEFQGHTSQFANIVNMMVKKEIRQRGRTNSALPPPDALVVPSPINLSSAPNTPREVGHGLGLITSGLDGVNGDDSPTASFKIGKEEVSLIAEHRRSSKHQIALDERTMAHHLFEIGSNLQALVFLAWAWVFGDTRPAAKDQ
jgi:hypothetical protein